ncbi:MAG: cache domain-containing protein, partial [bacterium]
MVTEHQTKKKESSPESGSSLQPTSYTWLARKLIIFVLLCAVLPLLLLGWGINIHYTKFAKARMTESLEEQIDHHRRTIELFLEGRKAQLQLLASTHSLASLADSENLAHIFQAVNQEQWSITDLGVIAENGDHLAYVGPFNLMGRNYAEAFWFKEVIRKGVYISDMFLGFRNEPHFVIAVSRTEQGRKWILRATIDTEYFRSLVEEVWIGQTGEVYLLNRQGVFQTSPRFQGEIMGEAALDMPPEHEGTAVAILPATRDAQGRKIPKKVYSHTWLDEPSWLLMVKQDYQEAFNAVYHANWVTLVFIHLTALAIIVVAVVITRRLIALIRKRDREAQELNRQLMQAGKLAAIGELSAGVAHEINNPLAIILTERQLILDSLERGSAKDPAFAEQLQGAMDQIDTQIDRCQRITQNLLRFARRTESQLEWVDLNLFLLEIVELVERKAQSSGITFTLDLDQELPRLLSDPSQ